MHRHSRLSRPLLGGMGIFALAALASLGTFVALAWGCARAAPGAPSLLLDPQLAAGDQSIFEQPFEDGPASIRLGPGWQEPEKSWPQSGRHGIAWAEQAARIYFGVPLSPAADLVAVGVPLRFPGSPRQMLTPVLNGTELASQPMPADWSELRIPLPAAALTSPINTLDLNFTYEAVPAKVGLGADERSLAAAFDLLAVVPHGAPLTLGDATAPPAGPPGQQLVLHRQPTAIPLPPAQRIDVELGTVHPTASGLQMGVDLETWDNTRRPLWHGDAAGAGGRSLQVQVPGQRPARLLLSVEGGAARAEAAADAIWMEPPAIRVVPAAGREPASPDVFVYLIDTLRADPLGVYGSPWPTSPRIDAFSRDAVVFERAFSASAWTLPATFSVLSGLSPSHHGVIQPGDRLPAERQPWLPDLLSRRGYETLAISQWLLGGDPFGLNRGFDSFYLNVRQTEKNPSATARWFLWHHLLQRRRPDIPLFTYLHVVDPHAQYRPQGEDGRFAGEHPGTLPPQLYDPNYFLASGLGRNHVEVEHLRALYDGEVHAADRAFGTFLDLLKFFGLYDRSMIVLLSDHGEEFYEHGGFDHGRTLYDELLRVPLIVKFPHSQQAGTRVAAPVSLLDVAPTIAALAGAAAAGFDGMPLQRSGRGADGAGGRQRAIVAETKAVPVDLRAVRNGSLKCIENVGRIDRFSRPAPAWELFDVAADPGERAPLPPSDGRFDRCRALLQAEQPAVARPAPLAPEEKARLRALGYLR
ncbi:MAG: sulfatase [Acidobacteria bacterium]|nr:sulfatase [Acidobacteriota bacterium]